MRSRTVSIAATFVAIALLSATALAAAHDGGSTAGSAIPAPNAPGAAEQAASSPAAAGRAAPSPAAADPDATARKVALGLSIIDYDNVSRIDNFTAQLGGHAPAIWSIWSDWAGANSAFPSTLVQQLRLRGVTPLILWQPVNATNPNDSSFNYKRIAKGLLDTYIRAWATAAKASNSTVLLRFAHEMDGTWFPWGIGSFGTTNLDFVAAWKHIWTIFRGTGGVGATNVKFVWSPMLPVDAKPAYPGDAYVDYVGATAFYWGPPQDPKPVTMVKKIGYKAKQSLAFTQKPIIVCELGTTAIGGGMVSWITDGYPAVYAAWPKVVAIVYFDIDMRPDQPDWRMEPVAGAIKAYAGVAASPNFSGGIPGKPAAGITIKPATKSRTVPITWRVGDPGRVGIGGYFVSTSGTTPALTARGWTTTRPTSITLPATDGPKTVYAWVKDAHGILSPRAAAKTFLDTKVPTAKLAVPCGSTCSKTVTITLTGTDPGGSGIAGFIVSTKATVPAATDARWTRTAPKQITVTTSGAITVYAWSKDSAGNVSTAAKVQITVTSP